MSNNTLDELNTLKSQFEAKIQLAESLPETYAAEKARLITNAQNRLNMLNTRINLETERLAKLQDQEYLDNKKFGQNLSIECLRECKAIFEDSNLTLEQKELLIHNKGGCIPTSE